MNLIRAGASRRSPASGREGPGTADPSSRAAVARRRAGRGRGVLPRAPPPAPPSIRRTWDTKHLRNAIRLRVIPEIERATGREVKRPIARSADLPPRGPVGAVRLDRRRVRAGRQWPAAGAPVRRRRPRVAARTGRSLASSASLLYRVMEPEDAAPWTRDGWRRSSISPGVRPGRRRDPPNGSTARREREHALASLGTSPGEPGVKGGRDGRPGRTVLSSRTPFTFRPSMRRPMRGSGTSSASSITEQTDPGQAPRARRADHPLTTRGASPAARGPQGRAS